MSKDHEDPLSDVDLSVDADKFFEPVVERIVRRNIARLRLILDEYSMTILESVVKDLQWLIAANHLVDEMIELDDKEEE